MDFFYILSSLIIAAFLTLAIFMFISRKFIVLLLAIILMNGGVYIHDKVIHGYASDPLEILGHINLTILSAGGFIAGYFLRQLYLKRKSTRK